MLAALLAECECDEEWWSGGCSNGWVFDLPGRGVRARHCDCVCHILEDKPAD